MYRTRVHSGKGKKPTRDDVAKYAQISGATVSRVLSGRTDISISDEARARVLEAARTLGYHPNAAARALTSGRTGLIGFSMSFDYSRYRGQVLDQMRTVVGQTELTLAVTDVDKEFRLNRSFERALKVPVDGIIAFDNSASVDVFAREHDRLAPNVPFVSMGAYWSDAQSFVGIDLREGADAAMNHLLSQGRRKIAYMAPWTSDLIDQGPRFDAYREGMTAAGLEPRTVGVESASFAKVKEELVRLRNANDLPEAILCMNDDLAIACAYILSGLGIAVGPDVALVGFDGIEEGEHCPVPITTVRQPIEEMCEMTFRFLQNLMDDPAADLQQHILKPKLVIRESTRT